MYSIGIDLGGTNIAVGAVNENYEIISYYTTPTNAAEGGDAVVRRMYEAVCTVMGQKGLKEEDCSVIGIGAPGTCDVVNGIVYRSYSMDWTNFPLADKMHQYTDIPVRINNDANCAALGEVKAGAAKGHDNAVLVTLGTGIGTGIILGGKILTGLKGNGTEMGHMTINFDGENCVCGFTGCWDHYAAATALVNQAAAAAKENPASALNSVLPLNGKKIFDAADAGDKTALDVIDRYCGYLAVGAVNIVNILAPEIILFGGGISRQGDRILKPVREFIAKKCFDARPEALPEIKAASLGNEAGIVGAAAL